MERITDLTTKNLSDVRLTPDWILDQVVYPTLETVNVDPCAESRTNPNVKADFHFTKEYPAQLTDLKGSMFMNPPFSQTFWFLGITNNAFNMGLLKSAVVLVKSDTRTNWFQKQIWDSPFVDWIYFTRYVKFKTFDNDSMISAPFPVCLVNFNQKDEDLSKFYQACTKLRTGKILPVSVRACEYKSTLGDVQ